jgi:hypothetical protein
LARQTIAIGLENEKRVVILIPAGNEIEIARAVQEGDPTVEVLWESKQVTMFVIDIQERGSLISPST